MTYFKWRAAADRDRHSLQVKYSLLTGHQQDQHMLSLSPIYPKNHLVNFSIQLTTFLVWFIFQSQRDDELAPQLPPSIAEENIHYGEIDFSKRRPEPSSDSVQDSGQQQDTVYAQVNVSKPANTSRHTADGPEDLYAHVKKKWVLSWDHICLGFII